jgi:hypothetical protein
MDVHERRRRARQAATSGDYAFALSEYIWYHDHVLAEAPSQYGVRLSYALADWIELGSDYPPALRALEDIVDKKTGALLAGDGNVELFHDVVAINDYLGRGRATYDLFVKLRQERPDLAAKGAHVAFAAILAADFSLARAYTPDINARIEEANELLELSLRSVKSRKSEFAEQMFEVGVTLFVAKIQMLSRMLSGLGETEEEVRLRRNAVNAVRDPNARALVQAALFNAPAA